MRPAGRVLSLWSVAIIAAGCAEQPSGPLASPLTDRSSAPGLQQGCSDKPGNHLARRPNAPLELQCAFALPAGDQPIQNGTKTWVEDGRLYMTELKNAAMYVWDATDHSLIGKVTGFVGSTGVAATSGPNALTLSGDGHAWVSDGISAVQVVDLSTMSIIATINTAIPACGTKCQRTNEITFDPEHHIIFVQNPSPLNAANTAIDTYGTFISSDPPYEVLGTITFPDRRGQEAPLWDPDQHRIVTTVSGRQAGATVFSQYVAVIDPTVRPFVVEHQFDIDCPSLGLTGFGINDPALGPDEKMVIPGCGRALIMNAVTGAITDVMAVGGGNETTYNPGDGNFYVTGANFSTNPAGPNSLGVIDAATSTMRQYITALNATNPSASFDNRTNNNEVFAVVAGNANATACTPFGLQSSGCILVFAHVPGGD